MDIKEYVIEETKKIIGSLLFVKSAAIVGSFDSGVEFTKISDVDVVIIVDKLAKEKFDKILEEWKVFGNKITKQYGYEIIINSAFGPLKFNKENAIVFHVMIYDIEGHIRHCKESPFTCLDWQNSSHVFKIPLSSIFSVTNLQPNDFFDGRRGIHDYLKDFQQNKISYRKYAFTNEGYSEIKKYKELDKKHKFEFAYHIMKYSMLNFLKLYYQENLKLMMDEVLKKYFEIFPWNKESSMAFFMKIKALKELNSFQDWAEDEEQKLIGFLDDFQKQFKSYFYDEAHRILFMRHCKTPVNIPGVFIGQKTDSDILPLSENILKEFFKQVGDFSEIVTYTSPSKRCCNTLDALKRHIVIKNIIVDKNLAEINYGDMDGKDIAYLAEKYPDIIKRWEKKEDPRFPNGENTADVQKRFALFLSRLKQDISENKGKKQYLVCTHNVVLRCLLGSFYKIPLHFLNLIDIPYVYPIEVIIPKNRKIYINLTGEQKKEFFKKAEERCLNESICHNP